MLLDIVTKGSTDRSVVLRIIDSTDGTPETGVVFNTAGIDLWYRREGAVKTSITEATLSALTDAHSDGGFLAVGDGYYRLDVPDAAFATSANYVDFGGTVTGMVVIGGRVRLTDFTLETASVAQTGDNYARLGAPAGASIAADLVAIKSDSAAILVDTGTTLDGKIDTIDGNVDDIETLVAAMDSDLTDVKAKTDPLTYTVANVLDSNVQRINDVAITGDGAGTPFDVA